MDQFRLNWHLFTLLSVILIESSTFIYFLYEYTPIIFHVNNQKIRKDKIKTSSCAPTSLARNSAAAESEDGQKFRPPNPLPYAPPSVQFGARTRRQFRSKRFGFVKKTHKRNK
jgi:hypothetical protein